MDKVCILTAVDLERLSKAIQAFNEDPSSTHGPLSRGHPISIQQLPMKDFDQLDGGSLARISSVPTLQSLGFGIPFENETFRWPPREDTKGNASPITSPGKKRARAAVKRK